jgi:hypothetical protein
MDIIDRLKSTCPCPLDGDNALMNIRERATALANRVDRGERRSSFRAGGATHRVGRCCGHGGPFRFGA